MTWLNWFVVCISVAVLAYAFRTELVATVTRWFSRAEKDVAKAEEEVKQEVKREVKQEAEIVIRKV